MKNLWLLLLLVSIRPVHAQLFGGQIKSPRAIISQLNCANATVSATVYSNVAINGINVTVPIVASNGGTYISQAYSSTGVTGLTLTSGYGMIPSGSSNIVFTLSGTANTVGNALFNVAIGGQACSISVVVVPFANQYPANSVFCANGPTAIVDVTNPTTGKTWMDRNLGASQVATSSTNNNAYGDLYQWGRRADGHQCRTSPTTATLSSVDQPAHGSFILAPNVPYNWRSPQNTNLWQGVNGVNNPCPNGYRIPTDSELEAERLSWISNNGVGAFASLLKWTLAGRRNGFSNGSLANVGNNGFYWSSSTVSASNSRYLNFTSSSANMFDAERSMGYSVRCLKETVGSVGALNCGGATTSGNLFSGSAANNVSTSVPYTGGNGGFYAAQSIASNGVPGLTATLNQGLLVNGSGNVTYTITGTPASSGTATFNISLGGQTCNMALTVTTLAAQYPANSVFCNYGPTAINEVINPITGRTWMDRNLGASIASSGGTGTLGNDGDYYQWGRNSDGHQCTSSLRTTALSSNDQPNNGGYFIETSMGGGDWRSPSNNNLWQGIHGTNNPCPNGFRLPTENEWNTERSSWGNIGFNQTGSTVLKLDAVGFRAWYNTQPEYIHAGFGGTYYGFYWSCTVLNGSVRILRLDPNVNSIQDYPKPAGIFVRCIKDIVGSIGAINCNGSTQSGNLISGQAASIVTVSVPYTGGNGGFYAAQSISSSGVIGLTATLTLGFFANGVGTLTFNISGVPATSGTASFAVTLGGQSCTYTLNVAVGINCAGATNTGTLTSGAIASGVSVSVPYTGGNGGAYGAQSEISFNVAGLTANLAAGTFANGSGSLSYTISGTPATSGAANFAISLGGQSCTFTVGVAGVAPEFPAGMVNCAAGATAIVNITNPTTGRIWMNRNLGASQVAYGSNDLNAHGDLYQWGRRADGHQCRTSPITANLSSTDQPPGSFILAPNFPYDWRSPQNLNLWQGVNGVNNPCPSTYRIPTDAEWIAEAATWAGGQIIYGASGVLKLTFNGFRKCEDGQVVNVNGGGTYWSSTFSGTQSFQFGPGNANAQMNLLNRANGYGIRCIKN